MFKPGEKVKVTKEFYYKYIKGYYSDYNLTYDTEYMVTIGVLDNDEYCEIESYDGWKAAVENKYLIKSISVDNIIEELYELILKENCSKELKSKFWDLHRILSSKEKEINNKLDEIKKLL